MTVKHIFITAAAAALPLGAAAQGIYGEPSVEKRGQKVELGIELGVPKDRLGSNYKVMLTPFVCNGGDTLFLSPVTFYGRQRYRRERQEHYLRGDRSWTLPEGSLMAGSTYAYGAEFAYERWMRRLDVGVKRRLIGCACDCYDGEEVLAEGVQVYKAPRPVVVDAVPDACKFVVKEADRQWDFGRHGLKVVFRVSSTVLNTSLSDNEETLGRIVEAVRRIQASPEYRFSRIAITGAASPEGPVAFNRKLGAGRAAALRDYVIGHVDGLTEADFELENYREDWAGLRDATASSAAYYRDDVLRVLDDTTLTSEQRKARLKAMGGGRPYREMLRTVYPGLRSACYIAVYYDLMHDPAADAVNSAVALVHEGRYAEALALLQPYADDSRTYNVIGVCHMMMEDEPEAIRWFHKAVEAGDKSAKENLRQVE